MFLCKHHKAETLLQVISSFLIKFSFSEKNTRQTATKTDSTDVIQVNANDKVQKIKTEHLQKHFFLQNQNGKSDMEGLNENKLSLDQSASCCQPTPVSSSSVWEIPTFEHFHI